MRTFAWLFLCVCVCWKILILDFCGHRPTWCSDNFFCQKLFTYS